ncbi:hypothetical protein [Streptomyces sp. NPDC002908]|uniref:hypothetical protein n=1 Tax=Streptomyces sp. NPDC002908 TaxID=3364670 RepID=UPI0036B4D5A0
MQTPATSGQTAPSHELRCQQSPDKSGAALPPIDWEEGLKKAQRAWKDHVPETQGSADEMWAVVVEDLETVDQTSSVLDCPLPMGDPAGTDTSSAEASSLVNSAMQDAASSDLQSLPEWQRIQTIRGATGHLMTTIEEKASEYWNELRTDARFQGSGSPSPSGRARPSADWPWRARTRSAAAPQETFPARRPCSS